MCVAPCLRAYQSASASTSRPSASVFVTSIVLPFAAREDVAGPVGVAAGHVLAGGRDRQHAERQPEVGDRAGRLDHGGAAGHVALHVLHVQGRLERDAARVEGDRLADEARARRPAASGSAARSASRSDAAGCGSPCATAANAPIPSSLISSGPSASAVRFSDDEAISAARAASRSGVSLVRRAVDEVAGAVRPLGDLPRSGGRFLQPVGLAAEDERLELGAFSSSFFQRAGS